MAESIEPTEQKESFYLTTAINYTNGPPHIGHAYEAIGADIVARFQRLFGKDVFFLTGTDEHGQKIADTAKNLGMTPIQLCNKNVQLFKDLNTKLLISNDGFIRTTSDAHKEIAQEVWKKAEAAGDIYLGTYSGWYNIREERFIPETEAKMDNYLDKVSGKPLQKYEEPSYFFRLSKYKGAIVDWINTHPEFIAPETRKKEILKRLDEEDLTDLSISRTSFDWGIPIPSESSGDQKHIMYVWFDALTNYLSGVGQHVYLEDQEHKQTKRWPADVHIIGQDIIWFHTVIWPAMLLSIGQPLPKMVFSHGFVIAEDGVKMSKTLGNTVDPNAVIEKYGAEPFRWYLIRETKFGDTLSFSEKGLVTRFNAELADEFLNLVNRSVSLAMKYINGLIPDLDKDIDDVTEFKFEQPFDVDVMRTKVKDCIDNMDIHGASNVIVDATRQTNRWVNELAPWSKVFNPLKIAGTMTEVAGRLATCPASETETKQAETVRKWVCTVLVEASFILAHFYQPFIPNIVNNIFGMYEERSRRSLSDLHWNMLMVTSEIVPSSNPLFKKFQYCCTCNEVIGKDIRYVDKGKKRYAYHNVNCKL